MSLEIEVKFFIEDLAAFRERLVAAGGVLVKERVFERNVRFDTPDERLRQRFELLRLRQDTAVRITFKAPSAEQEKSEAKVREEIEVTVDDFEKTAVIFERLGFGPLQTYEKYRETFEIDEVELVLDELPYGNFVEFEGEEGAIRTAVSHLNLDWSDRLNTNYLALMGQVKAHYGLDFDDLTFEKFDGQNWSVKETLTIDN